MQFTRLKSSVEADGDVRFLCGDGSVCQFAKPGVSGNNIIEDNGLLSLKHEKVQVAGGIRLTSTQEAVYLLCNVCYLQNISIYHIWKSGSINGLIVIL